MSIDRAYFFGASVISFNSEAGWNGQSSTLKIDLVEDLRNGDAFIAPPIGAPVYFNYNGFYFGGLFQNVTYRESEAGKTYTCSVVDPRELLNGVQVILSEYTGTVNGIANLLNVYGYLESSGFGNSDSNASGIKWNLIRSSLIAMSQLDIDFGYGGPIAYKGYTYLLDASSLPILPDDFRITGNASLMDLIGIACEAAGLDILFDLVLVNNLNYIRIKTVSRAYVPVRGSISRFIAETPGAVSKAIGEDMVNETVGRFVVGAKKRDIYFQFANGPYHYFFKRTKNTVTEFQVDGPTDGYNNTIWPFWGLTLNGTPVVGDGQDDDHVFTLDSRRVAIPGVGETYTTSLGEIRAALSSMEDWQTYLTLHNDIDYLMNENGTETAEFPRRGKKTDRPLKYPTNGVRNPHKGKAKRIGLYSGITADTINFLADTLVLEGGKIPYDRMIEVVPGKRENATEKLYSYIKDYAEQYYGIKFMVYIPNIEAAEESNSDIIRTNVIPTDGGYLSDSNIQAGVSNNLVPLDVNMITNYENGLVRAYVRFDNVGELDFSAISEDQIMWSANGESIFIECTVDTDIIFLGPNYTQPRVVINLPGRVTLRKNDGIELAYIDIFIRSLLQANWDEENTDKTVEEKKEESKKAFRSPSLTYMFEDSNCVDAVIPTMAAIPLESQVSRYGPWSAAGAIGAMEYEQDDTLNPWTYGGYTNLELVGNSKVVDSIGNLQYIESGAVDFPGMPNISLADRLMDSGPYVSNIQVSISPNGVITTYRMETWKIKFGNVQKAFADKVQRIEQENIKIRRNFNELIRINSKRNKLGR